MLAVIDYDISIDRCIDLFTTPGLFYLMGVEKYCVMKIWCENLCQNVSNFDFTKIERHKNEGAKN